MYGIGSRKEHMIILYLKWKSCILNAQNQVMARDIIHEAVKTALINDGWTVTDDPLRLFIPGTTKAFEVDLGAEKVIGAEKEGKQIAVEIKSFSKSILNQFHEALGQYMNYLLTMQLTESPRELFLAVSSEVYLKMTELSIIQIQLKRQNVKVIVVDIQHQKIEQWIK